MSSNSILNIKKDGEWVEIPCLKGEDGFSPTATVEKVGKVATITITDINGTTTATIADGTSSGGSGEENTIESISVNGTPISVDENKNVDITVPSIEGLTKDADLATVAKSGNYDDLANKPEIPSVEGLAKTTDIPTKVSQLKNDSNYLSSIPEEYVTDTELEAKGYLTEHQDISGKVDKVEGKSLISDAEIARLATVDNYDDIDIKAEIAKKADATAIPSKVSELTNDSNYQTAEQVNSTVTTEIAKVVADAPEDFDTLKEMSDWIAGHKDDASTMNSAISDNKTAITALQTGKADKSEIPTTVAELTDSADYAKTANVNDSISALQTNKADASDLTAHTDDTNIHVTADNKATWNTVSNKVDKEDGKGLSANDYTNEEKALVGTIEDKINKTSIVTALDDTVTDEQVASALLAKTELDKKIDKTSIATELSDASTDDEVIGALTAYNELQKLESATRGQFSTASGDSITVNDSVDGKLVELGIKGNSLQQTYRGVNLLNPNWIPTNTKNGVTVTNNGDNSWTFSGSIADNTKAFELSGTRFTKDTSPKEFHKVGYYTMSVKGITLADDNQYAYVTFYYNGKAYYNLLKNSTTVRITEEMLAYDDFHVSTIGFYIAAGSTLKTGTVSVQIEYSETATEFEPYVGGIPAPNPSYPQEIKSVGDDGSIVVKSRGKNMIPFPYYDGMGSVINGITFTTNEDGSVTANGTAIGNAYFRFANKNMYSLEYGKTYAISRGKTKDICMYAQNSKGDFVVLKVDESVKFTCNDTWRYIGCYVPKDTTVTNETIYPMLVEVNEDGTYPTEYEPYKSSTSTIPLSEPLRAIGDIKDEITYQDGKWGVLRRIKKLVADTPTKINPSGSITGIAYDILVSFGTINSDSYNVVNKKSDVSKHVFYNYQSKNVWSADECGAFISWSGLTSARLSSSICGSTLDEVKAYFKNNPLIGQYVLATPVFEPFADQTLPYLSTYDGVTNISNDDALSAEMTVKYPTTDASGIGSRNENRIAELAKDTDDKFDDVNESLSVIGKCKNLLNTTLQTTTQNGITCTNNGDGTYTLNGTATKEAIFVFLSDKQRTSIYKNTVGKTLKFLNGGAINPPVGRFIFTLRDGNKWWSKGEQHDNSIFTVSEGYAETIVDLHIYKDQTVTDLIVKPMLTTNLSATYDDFVPYTGEGETLTHDVAELKNDLKNNHKIISKTYDFGGDKKSYTIKNLTTGSQEFIITSIFRNIGVACECDGNIVIHKETTSGIKVINTFGASEVFVTYDSLLNEINITTTKGFMTFIIQSDKDYIME